MSRKHIASDDRRCRCFNRRQFINRYCLYEKFRREMQLCEIAGSESNDGTDRILPIPRFLRPRESIGPPAPLLHQTEQWNNAYVNQGRTLPIAKLVTAAPL